MKSYINFRGRKLSRKIRFSRRNLSRICLAEGIDNRVVTRIGNISRDAAVGCLEHIDNTVRTYCIIYALREKERLTDKQKTSEVRNVPKLVSFAGYCAVWEGLRYN